MIEYAYKNHKIFAFSDTHGLNLMKENSELAHWVIKGIEEDIISSFSLNTIDYKKRQVSVEPPKEYHQ